MADIEALLGLRSGPGADMQALADELRGQKRMGDFLSISTLKPVSRLGQTQQKRAMRGAARAGALHDTMMARKQAREDAEARFEWRQEQAEQAEKWREEEREFQRGRRSAPTAYTHTASGETVYLQADASGQMVDAQGQPVDMAQYQPYVAPSKTQRMPKTYKTAEGDVVSVVPDGRGGFQTVGGKPVTDMTGWTPYDATATRGVKPPGKQQDNFDKARDLAQQMNSVNELYNTMTQEQREGLASPLADVATSMLPTAVGTYVKGKRYTDPAIRKYQEKLARIESDFSKLASGLAVTGFEMKDRQKWSPFADGLTQDQRNSRIANLQELTSNAQERFNSSYPDYAQEVIPIATVNLEAEGEAATRAQVPEDLMPKVGEVRRGYEYVGGDPLTEQAWKPVDSPMAGAMGP